MGKQERQARRQARRERRQERRKQHNIKRCRRNKGRCSNEVRDKLGIEHYVSPASRALREQLKKNIKKFMSSNFVKGVKNDGTSQQTKGVKNGTPQQTKGVKKGTPQPPQQTSIQRWNERNNKY